MAAAVIRGLATGTLRYRAAWVLHRASGLGVLLFLFVHVGDTALVRLGPAAYDAVVAAYRNPVFRGLEAILVGAVLFHALNGLRITVQDLWPTQHTRRGGPLLAATYATTAILWLAAAVFVMAR